MADRRFKATRPDVAASTRGNICARRGYLIEQSSRGEGPPEAVDGVPGRRLAGLARVYQGYTELGASARLRLVPPTRVLLDISLGALPRLAGSGAVPAAAVYGMRTAPAVLGRSDAQGVFVELSPHGAYALLGVPLWEVTDTVIDWAEVLGRRAEQLVARLAETSGWQERLAVLDDVLAARADAGPQPAPQVVWAWQRLCRSGGRVPIGWLADRVGWTRRHLLTRFREQIGLSPKAAARVLRFQHALHLLHQPGHRRPLAHVAQVTGYSDQAHLTRECRTLAGATPVELTACWPHLQSDTGRD